ncbi:glycogen debranching N-terminal domain-containing protein [Hasllibacter halocynthiae]|uniref:glycogen debranching N-terminal domain-containing protein n=1 Tax=Hasllibacter halocynthiae TaxID=595589 RepID=UPI001304C484|nr:glycogen debranching N-terminal domain-containing protein [Hasllibacter halocynthiae]
MKCNRCFASLLPDGGTAPDGDGFTGFFLDDTRHLSRYAWILPDFVVLAGADGSARAERHLSRFREHAQEMRARRILTLRPDGFDDLLEIVNEDTVPHEVRVRLDAEADFRDIFETRGRERETIGYNPPRREGWSWDYLAQDGVRASTILTLKGWDGDEVLRLAPGEAQVLRVAARFASDASGPQPSAPEAGWTDGALAARASASAPVRQAFEDVEMLLLSSPDGPRIAAGLPNFVTMFGRDSLLTSAFVLDLAPSLAASTLRSLARYQGTKHDPVTREMPGAIPHEIRMGELSRTGELPFGCYYGTSDASALYVILARDHLRVTGDATVARELADHWGAALDWCRSERTPDGFLRYPAGEHGRGLANTSWKDSDDSMSHADGRLAHGRLAVVEVQGYLAAALDAGADLNEALGREFGTLRQEAAELRTAIDSHFWSDRIGMHALALTEGGERLEVASSNPGHLLWAGALTPERAAEVAGRLMRDDLWSGWGLRTLATGEERYRPLSYHNGSVWPHDTGLFAVGLARYGLQAPFEAVAEGLRDLAAMLPDHRLPELVGGYERGVLPPLPYLETCIPQAWAAAALLGVEQAAWALEASKSEQKSKG